MIPSKNPCCCVQSSQSWMQPLKLNSKLSRTQQQQKSGLTKVVSARVAQSLVCAFTRSIIHPFVHSFTVSHVRVVSGSGTRHTRCQGQGVVPHLDLLEGVFRLIQVLKREAHLVVQLSQPPVICLHRIRPRQVAIARYGCTQIGTGSNHVMKR